MTTQAQVTALIQMAKLQTQLRAAQLSMTNLDATQATAIAGINTQRATLQTTINTLTAEIISAITPSS